VTRRTATPLTLVPQQERDPLDQLARDISQEEELLASASFTALYHAFRLGEMLIKAKDLLRDYRLSRRGWEDVFWESWADEHLRLNDRTRRRWMRLARHRVEIEGRKIRTIWDAEERIKHKPDVDAVTNGKGASTRSKKTPRHKLQDYVYKGRLEHQKADDVIERNDDWVLDQFLVGMIEAMRQDADCLITMADKLKQKAKPDSNTAS